MKSKRERLVLWFSCGAASAVAARLALAQYRGKMPIHIVYTDPGWEHEDNERFLRECEGWFGHPIERLKHAQHATPADVFRARKFISSPFGASCTTVLKKSLRQTYEDCLRDLQVFGFTLEEEKRADRFRKNNPEVDLWCPLIDKMLTKADCLAMIKEAGIELPEMYRMGYRNNNCIGCVKGGIGYWNKIRDDFPERFAEMAAIEEELGAKMLRVTNDEGKRVRCSLRDLPRGIGRYEAEPDIECGLLCQMAKAEYDEEEDCEL